MIIKDNIVFHAHNCSMSAELDQAITKFMIEATGVCSSEHWRVSVTDTFGSDTEYRADFSTGGAVSDQEMLENPQEDRLHVVYHEVVMNDRDGLPDIKRRIAEVNFVAKEADGTRNKAVENGLYRTFAALYFKALDQFPTKFIKVACYVNGDAILF